MKQDSSHDDLHKIAEDLTKSDPQRRYVLITCSPGHGKQDLNVRMTYRGDPILIRYLLEGGAEKILSDIDAEAEADMERI